MITLGILFAFSAQLCGKLCCLPVCIVSWLASYTQHGHQGGGVGSVTAVDVLDRFVSLSTENEDAESLPHHAQRCIVMNNIFKVMRNELRPKASVNEDEIGKPQVRL